MKTKIELWGGFHNCNSINIVVNSDDAAALKEGRTTLADILTVSQEKKLERHFCGMRGCSCGSWHKASIEF